jgi:hypothetical protein
MTKMLWVVEFENSKHMIELEHGYFSGKRKITVDGKDLPLPKSESNKLLDYGSRHKFQLLGHECVIIIRSANGLTYSYELFMDKKPLEGTVTDTIEERNTEIRYKRLALIAAFGILGLAGMWFNWFYANKFGLYSRFIAAFSPPLVVWAIFIAIFNDDPTTFPRPLPTRLWALIRTALACGIMNVIAFEFGLF